MMGARDRSRFPIAGESATIRQISLGELHMPISKLAAVAVVFSVGVGAGSVAWADMPVPHQKPGLWDSSMTMAGRDFKTESCVTEESQAKVSVFSSQMRQKNCSASSVTHNMDGSWTSTSTCKFGATPRTTHARITGDFNSKITIEVMADDSDKPETSITMTWMGACKAGMKGGDVWMSNGMKMNVIDGTMSGMPQPEH
jgi:hypothetical protein